MLFTAIHDGNEEMSYILIQAGVNPGYINNCGTTALHLAASKGFQNLGMVIIEHRATELEMKNRINKQDENGMYIYIILEIIKIMIVIGYIPFR